MWPCTSPPGRGQWRSAESASCHIYAAINHVRMMSGYSEIWIRPLLLPVKLIRPDKARNRFVVNPTNYTNGIFLLLVYLNVIPGIKL